MSGTKSDPRRGTLAAVLIVAGAILLAHAWALLAGERYYFRDLSQNHGPVFEAARALLAAGDAPWWNPWSAGGKPLLANPNALLLTPAGLIATLLPSGLTLSILFGVLLAPVFLVLLLRDLGRSAVSAAAGGLAYGLSGFALSLGTLPNLLAASSWIPAALLFLRWARRRAVWTPVAVAACACVLIPCEPVSALVLFVFACLTVEGKLAGRSGQGRGTPHPFGVTGFRAISAPGGSLVETMTARPAAKGLVIARIKRSALTWTGTLLALGLGVAAFEIVPATMWILASARGSGLSESEATKWSLSALRLPELVAPGFLGDPSRLSSWWSASLFETGFPLILSLHVGVPVLLLAAWGTWTSFRSLRRDLGQRSHAVHELSVPLAGGAFLALASGALLSQAMRWVPGLDLFRYPEKFVLGTVLALAFQVALGVERLPGRWTVRRKGGLRSEPDPVVTSESLSDSVVSSRPLLAASAATAILLLLASALAGPGVVGRWFGLPESAAAFRGHAAEGVQVALVLGAAEAFAFLLALSLARRSRDPFRTGIVAAALLGSLFIGALVPGDAPLSWRVRANPSAPREILDQPPFFADRLERLQVDEGRLVRFERPPGFAVRNRTGTLADLFSWERRSLERSSAGAFGVELVYDRSTDRLDPRGEDAVRGRFETSALDVRKRFWDLASVRMILAYSPLDLPGLALAGRIEGESRFPVLLYENHDALPRERLVAHSRSAPSSEAALEAIARDPGTGWRDEVLLDERGILPVASSASGASAILRAPVRAVQFGGDRDQDQGVPGDAGSGPRESRSQGVEGASREFEEARTVSVIERHASRIRVSIAAALGPVEASTPLVAQRSSSGSESSEPDLRSAELLPARAAAHALETSIASPPAPHARPKDPILTTKGDVSGSSSQPISRNRGATRAEPGPLDWLVLAENHVPGWRATVDGCPAAIHTANGMFMAVPIDGAGSHVVELRYFPPGLLAGVVISGLAMAAAVVLAVRGGSSITQGRS